MTASGPAPSPAPRRGRQAALLAPAALLIAVALWEIPAALVAGDDLPDDHAWQRAEAAVRARHQPGDLIVFAPSWIDPVGRKHLGDLISLAMAGRMDDARYGTLWEVSIDGARAPESRGRAVTFAGDFGGVRVTRLVREPAEVVTDFVDALEGASVSGPAVSRPEARLEEVGFAPRRCVRVEPRAGNTVRVSYRGVALGRELVGGVGLADVFTRRDIREPGRLEVLIDGVPVAALEAGVDDGWVEFRVATEPGRVADVAFAATAVGPRAHRRLICFAAEARR